MSLPLRAALLVAPVVTGMSLAAPALAGPTSAGCAGPTRPVAYETPAAGMPAGGAVVNMVNKVRAYFRDIAVRDQRWEARPGTCAEALDGHLDPGAASAVGEYRAYLRQQADTLVRRVDRLTRAVDVGRLAKARQLYAAARAVWATIEPIAESDGDPGWPPMAEALFRRSDLTRAGPIGDRLAADARALRRRSATADIGVAQIGTVAKRLVDEMSTGKLTGEEEAFSDNDLAGIQANLDGADKAYEVLRPLVSERALLARLDAAFNALRTGLAEHRLGSGFVSLDRIGSLERRDLARLVDGLGEPLSHLTAAAS